MRKIFKLTALLAAGIACTSLFAACNNAEPKEAQEETETTLSGEETDALFNIGVTEDNTYTNDFFNVKFTGTDEWRLLNDEQLASISTGIKDVMTNEEAKKALEDGKTSIIMYAVSQDALKNASVTVEKHEINNTQDVDLDEFLDKSVESLSASLPGQGFEDLEVVKTDLTFCGEATKGIEIKAKYNVGSSDQESETESRNIFEKQIYVFRGSYSGCYTVSSFDEDNTGEILKMFSKYE